jgi:hemerythrin-like domain-containing protein
VIAAVILSIAFFVSLGFWPPSLQDIGENRPTELFRLHLRRHQEKIATISLTLDTIPRGSEMGQIDLMAAVVSMIRGELLEHARTEEQVLYPAVDRRAEAGTPPFTEVLLFERRLIERWTDELERMASEPLPDQHRFCVRGERLLGLLEAHVAVEEKVLLPILDKTMTHDQFRREVWNRMEIE